MLSGVLLFSTSQTVARQAPLSMGFPRQEYQSGVPFLPPGDLADRGIEPASPLSPELAGRFFTTKPPGKSPIAFTLLFAANTLKLNKGKIKFILTSSSNWGHSEVSINKLMDFQSLFLKK